MHSISRRSQLGLAATVALAVTLATNGSAGATPPAGSASVANDTVTVTGTRGADEVALRLAPGDPTTLQVDLDDDGSAERSFSRSAFSRIDVLLLTGDDHFRVDQINGPFADEVLVVDAGSGDDSVTTGDGNDLVLGGRGDDTVDGNRGVDSAVLGSGQDTFVWDPGDGSDRIDGGSGGDTLVFNGAAGNEVMSLSASGQTSLFLREPGTIRMDMQDVENLDLAALGGQDTITVNDLAGSTFEQADLDLGRTDGQPDRVTITGSEAADHVTIGADDADVNVDGLTAAIRLSSSEPANDQLQVNSLGGNDTVDVDAQAAALIGITVDLGSGQT